MLKGTLLDGDDLLLSFLSGGSSLSGGGIGGGLGSGSRCLLGGSRGGGSLSGLGRLRLGGDGGVGGGDRSSLLDLDGLLFFGHCVDVVL